MRTSKPYVETVEGEVTPVRAGDYVERDDGWWRAMAITIWSLSETTYHSEIEWVPVERTNVA